MQKSFSAPTTPEEAEMLNSEGVWSRELGAGSSELGQGICQQETLVGSVWL